MGAGKRRKEKEEDPEVFKHAMRDTAEEKITETIGNSSDLEGKTPEQLIHELQVHQVELETQAEDLRRSKIALEEARDKYLNLYEFAPVGYLTLTYDALIAEVNLSGATLLGTDRNQLERARFRKFIIIQDLDMWDRYFMNVLKQDDKQTCTLTLKREDGSIFPARLESVRLTGINNSTTTVQVAISDISDIRLAEDALAEREREYRSIFNNFPDLYYQTDLKGIITRLSPSITRLSGWVPEELIGHFTTELYPFPEERNGLIETLSRTGAVQNYEITLLHKDRRHLMTSVSGHLLYDDAGKPTAIEGTIRDISERKRADEKLRQISDRLSLATRAGGVGIWDYDVVNNTLTWDDRMFALYGITREQFGGAYEAWQAGLHPEDKQRGDDGIQMALRGEKEFDIEFRVLWPDGSIRNIRAFAIVQRDAGGKPLRMIGTNWDITARKYAEAEIKRQSGLIRSLLDSIPDIIFFKDREGVYLGCNPPFVEFVGKSREEIIGKTDYDLFNKEIADFFRENDKQMLELGESHHNEEWITYPDGRKILIDTLKTPYWGPDETLIGILGISRDITGRKRAENAVSEANKKLNILNSITRHDVLNQISVLVMTLELIEESVQDAGILDFVKKAEGATERITRQIEFTREYQDIGVLKPQWQNVSDIIVNAKEQLTTCPFDIRVDLGAVEIYADPLLPKVFYNLLENAVRYGEHVSTVCFSSRESVQGLTLVCEDNGAGVDAESKKHLFQQGFGKHTGFGLYLMLEILGITGITIRETGELGKGARFEIMVPKGAWRMNPHASKGED